MSVTVNLTQLKRKKREDGTIPIYIRITENRKSRYMSTGVAVRPKYWNPKSDENYIRKSHRRNEALNLKLREIKREVEITRDELKKNNQLSLNTLKNKISDDGPDPTSIITKAEAYRSKLKADDRYWEWRHFKVVIGNLKRYIKDREKDEQLDQVDTEWLEDFQDFLLKEGGPKKKGTNERKSNSNNTVRKKIQRLKGMFTHLIKTKKIDNDPFTGFEKVEAKRAQTKTKLSFKQIEAIENLNLPDNSTLWHIRNYFLFSFYNAGIRFGDLCCLQWKNIIDERLVYKMRKTGKQKSIKQLEPMQKILQYYRPEEKQKTDCIFPILDRKYSDSNEERKAIGSKNAIVNTQLKKLADKANIEANVSFHVSRHSFAQFALRQDMDLYSISKALGHSTLRQTEDYLKSFDEEKLDSDMANLFN